MRAGKVWGTTEEIFRKNNTEIHVIHTKRGGYSSMHCHRHKYNAFYVVSGSITVEVRKNDYDLTDVTILGPGEMTRVPPGEFHRFISNEDSTVLEIYWTELEASDIVREDHGGCLEEMIPIYPNPNVSVEYIEG